MIKNTTEYLNYKEKRKIGCIVTKHRLPLCQWSEHAQPIGRHRSYSFWGIRRTRLITQLLWTYSYYSGIKHFFNCRLIAMFLLLHFIVLIYVKGKAAVFSLTWVQFQKNITFLSSFIIFVIDSLQCLITALQSALSFSLSLSLTA